MRRKHGRGCFFCERAAAYSGVYVHVPQFPNLFDSTSRDRQHGRFGGFGVSQTRCCWITRCVNKEYLEHVFEKQNGFPGRTERFRAGSSFLDLWSVGRGNFSPLCTKHVRGRTFICVCAPVLRQPPRLQPPALPPPRTALHTRWHDGSSASTTRDFLAANTTSSRES